MIKKFMVALGAAGLLATLASSPTIGAPISNAPNPEITNADDFDNLATSVEENMGKRVKIAGQKIRVEESEEGLFVVAEFLPYPSDDLHFTDSAIGQPKPTKGRGRFTFLYPGKKNVTDPILTWKGQPIHSFGRYQGAQESPDYFVRKKY